jgi:hypothetical protein
MRAFVIVALIAGCGPGEVSLDDEVAGEDGKADSLSTSLKMPKAICDYENANMWGMHHVEWHTERRWDLLSASDLAWAKSHGYTRAAKQEGQAGNGLEFLAMHRAMIQMLRQQFPSQTALFDGWETPPTNPRDKQNPLPHGATTPFDDHMLDAISELETQLSKLKSDDDLGLYIETQLRPIAGNPSHRSSDLSTGIHNYMHNRFSDPSSPINIGDPTVNLENKMFWRLHGWIDARWTAFRAEKGLSDNDPAYLAALDAAMMQMHHHDGGVKGAPMDDTVPESLRHFVW